MEKDIKKLFKPVSLSSRGIRSKLTIVFVLMSIIPILVITYFAANYVFPSIDSTGILLTVMAVLAITITIALCGFILAAKMIGPIAKMSFEAKIIAGGDIGHRLKEGGDDEIGDLAKSINLITSKIKGGLAELETYSSRAKDVNLEIQKKIVVLSSLLQIGDMISTVEKLNDVLEPVVVKIGGIYDANCTALFLAKSGTLNMVPVAIHNISDASLNSQSFNTEKDYVGITARSRKILKIDSATGPGPTTEKVRRAFKMKNCLIMPIVSEGCGEGFLVTGNNENGYKFPDEDVELIRILCSQIGIAVENFALFNKAKTLILKDDLTGLYNEKYITERLEEEIQRSILYQRPCSLILFNLDNFMEFRDKHGEMATEEALKKAAEIIKEKSTRIDKAARLGGDEFAMVLSEMNKKEAAALAEDIRAKIQAMGNKLAQKGEKPLTVSGGVSENPIDGATAKALFVKAQQSLEKAKAAGRNKIVT